MSKLVTRQAFGGKRAVVGDRVVIGVRRHDGKEGVCLCAGVVHAISESDDVPWIARAALLEDDGRKGVAPLRTEHGQIVSEPTKALRFFFAPTESMAAQLPIGYWTWASFEVGV